MTSARALQRIRMICAALAFALACGPAHAASLPTATLHTTAGDIVIELNTAKAPITANNFIRYAKIGYYDNIIIYRAVPGFLIQMGDETADGRLKSALFRPIQLETATGLRHGRGTVSLTHGDSANPNSGDSTFYIDLGPNPQLNPSPHAKPNTTGDAVFGRVIKGMDVVDKIAAAPRKPKKEGGDFPGQEPKTPVVVEKVVVSGG